MGQVKEPEVSQARVTDASFDVLREILLKEDRQRLDQVEFRLDDTETRVAELAAVLSEAMNLASKEPRFARVLAPTIEKSLYQSVRANPEGIADALFPVLMPTIRRVVLSLLERTFENFNRVLDVSVSPRSFAWRLESWRTGKPFAEIVLYHTVQYRVEQVLLIHRDTGLLLAQAGVNPSAEADLVGAMLTAIQDFARDSFQMGNETIRTFQIGDLTVLVETAPHATIAAAVRGTPPAEIADALAVALETIELRFSEQLAGFVGDSSLFEGVRPILEGCLTTVYLQQVSQQKKETRKRVSRFVVALMVLGVVALSFWFGFEALQNQRWREAMAKLRLEPGYLVLEDSKNRLVGLRDPLARDPQLVLQSLGYSNVNQAWGVYQSLDPELVLKRVRLATEPASSTVLGLREGVLVLSGQATENWVKRTKLIVRGLSGVFGVDSSAVEFVEATKP
ncbi:MAG: hypothetical protein ACK41E_06050 [Deinococcales bacterium]